MLSGILVAGIGSFLLGTLLTVTSIFLILLILVQRGKGGGLTGALGGMGGQSAFGAKAGDTFTWVTVGVAIFWILLSIFSVLTLDGDRGVFGRTPRGTVLPDASPGGPGGDGQDPSGQTPPLPGSSGPAGGASPSGPLPDASDLSLPDDLGLPTESSPSAPSAPGGTPTSEAGAGQPDEPPVDGDSSS